jgi:uncharacterized protein (TIGR02171 family)
MVAISSQNQSCILGSNESIAKGDEKPAMRVSFSYDFWIDTCEVTKEMYFRIMGLLPKEYDSIAQGSPQAPVAYVSWFDAVLFCNARSKAERRDTVYSYIGKDTTAKGSTYSLRGLSGNLAVAGYRLPTEAEWEYAGYSNGNGPYEWGKDSSADSAESYCWYERNALKIPHDVRQKKANGFGLFDMGGNVMEWINDQKSSFMADTIKDFAGGTGNSMDERIVKGGCFLSTLWYLRLSARSDAYATTSATRTRYIGFRCVAGQISSPTFKTSSGVVNGIEPFYPSVPSLKEIVGSSQARIAFVNVSGEKRTLCFVDYSKTGVSLHQFLDDSSVYTPTISPNGAWVAYCSQGEGLSGPATTSIRSIEWGNNAKLILPETNAQVPRWWVDPATQDTFVVYVTSSIGNDMADWSSSQTRMQQFSNGSFIGTAIAVEAAGSYHDGLSKSGRYIATGYPKLRMKDRLTGTEHILFCSPQNGKSAGDTSQTCNASISPDSVHEDRALLLDFGSGGKVSSLTNTIYGLHQCIFMVDFSGQVNRWYGAPEGYNAWDHSEWSNRYDYAIANATDNTDRHRAIYVISLADSQYTKVIEGTDICNPYCWIGDIDKESISGNLDLDSVGQYNVPSLVNPQALLSYKMRSFWALAESLEVIFVGSSNVMDGIDPRYFTGFVSYNMGVGGGELATSHLLITRYILPTCKKLRLIGMSIDIPLFYGNYETDVGSCYSGFIQSKGFQYDQNHQFWPSGVPSDFLAAILNVPIPLTNPPTEYIDPLGLARFGCNGWQDPICIGDTTWKIDHPNVAVNWQLILDLVDQCGKQGVDLLFVVFPFNPKYGKTNIFNYLGASQTTARAVMQKFIDCAANNPRVHFYDANNYGNHDYTDDDAYDQIHLCEHGAQKLSLRLDSLMHTIVSKP